MIYNQSVQLPVFLYRQIDSFLAQREVGEVSFDDLDLLRIL